MIINVYINVTIIVPMISTGNDHITKTTKEILSISDNLFQKSFTKFLFSMILGNIRPAIINTPITRLAINKVNIDILNSVDIINILSYL